MLDLICKIKMFFGKSRVCCCDENDEDIILQQHLEVSSPRVVVVQYPIRSVTYLLHDDSTDELLNKINRDVKYNHFGLCLYPNNELSFMEVLSFYVMFDTHVVRPNLKLSDYNAPHNFVVQVHFPTLLGGSEPFKTITYSDIILPPYRCVLQCEKQVLLEYPVTLFVKKAEVQGDFSDILSPFTGKIDDTLLKLLEDIILCSTLYIKSRDAEDITLAITTFAKLRFKGSLINSSLKLMESVINLLEPPTEESVFLHAEYTPEVQGTEKRIDDVRTIIKQWRNIKNSGMGKKYKSLLGVMCKFGAFSLIGIDPPKSWKGETVALNFLDSGDLIFSLIDTLTYTVQRVCIYARTGNWDTFIHGPEQYMKWYDDSLELRRLTLNMSNLSAHKTNYHDVVARVKKAIEQGRAIVKYADVEVSGEMKQIKQTLNDLLMIEANILTKKASQENRRVPFSCLVHGKSGVAKSMFTNLIGYYYSKRYDLPSGSEYRHTRIFTDEYWSGFSSEQWWIHLDDVALFHHSKIMGPDPTTCDLISVCNPFAFSPNQAALEDKGKTPMKARLVTATTNTKDMNVSKFFQCPLAVQRRLPFVFTVTPKQEFCKNDSPDMIDPSKIPIYDHDWPNVWNIAVEKVVAGGTTGEQEMAQFQRVKDFTEINAFLDWFYEVSMEFERIQDKALRDDSYMLGFKLCLSCNRVNCECLTLADLSTTGAVRSGHATSNLGDYFSTDDVIDYNFGANTQGFDELEKCDISYPHQNETEIWEDDISGGVRYVYNKVRKERYVTSITPKSRTKTKNGWMCELPLVVSEYCDIIDMAVAKVMKDETSVLGKVNATFITYVTKAYVRWSWARNAADYMMSFSYVRRLVHWYAGRYISISKGARLGMWYLGEFAYKSYMKIEWLKIMQGLVLATSLWKGYTMTSSYVQGETLSVPVVEKAETIVVEKSDGSEFKKDEKENVWKNDDYVLTPMDLTPTMSSYATLPRDQVKKIIFRNTAKIVCRGIKMGERRVSPANALCVGGHLWVTTNHTLLKSDDGKIEIELISQIKNHGVTPNVRFTLEEVNVMRDENLDLAFFECFAMDAGKNLLELFPLHDLKGSFDGVLMGRSSDYQVFEHQMRCVQPKFMYAQDHKKHYSYWFGKISTDTQKGDCGSVLVAMQPQVMILGLHQLGGAMNRAASLRLCREMIDKAIAHFGRPIIQGEFPKLCSEKIVKIIGPLSHRSPLRWLENGTCKVYGSFAGWRARPRSRVSKTILYETLKEQREWDPKYARPEMDDWRPWRYAYKAVLEQTHTVKESVLKACVSAFADDIISGLQVEDLQQLKILGLHAAVNGVQGVRFLDKMNFNSSMGEPWCTTKKKFIEPAPSDSLPEAKMFNQEVCDRVRDIEQLYLRGSRACPVFSGQLKDEVRAESKVREGKLRAFLASPVDWSVVVRMYLLTFIMVFQNNPLLFEGAPGCVAQSLEWEKFMEHLVKFGSHRMVAGDYKEFDKKMIARLIIAAFEVIIAVLRKAGWPDQHLLVVWCIAEDTAYAWVNFNGDFIQFMGSNPSGHPLTVIINCLVNSLYLRYCYFELNPKREVTSFKKNVSLLTYGDDNAFGVSEESSWFNHTSISEHLLTIGVVYTMADKTSESVPFIHIRDVSFLKRTWKWDDDVGAYLCPLEEDSIRKSLMFTIPSTILTPKMHMMSVMTSAVNEFFFYGKDRFEQERNYLLGLIHYMDMVDEYLCNPFPTWETLYIRFWKSSRGVVLDRDVDRYYDNNQVVCRGAENSSRLIANPTSQASLDLVKVNLDLSRFDSVLIGDNPNACISSYLGLGALGAQNKIQPTCSMAVLNVVNKEQATQYNSTCLPLNTKSILTEFEMVACVQSASMPVDATMTSSLTTQQTTQFLDANMGGSVGYTPDVDYIAESDGVMASGLAEFLSRPVRIYSHTWLESDVIGAKVSFSPWFQYFNDTAIKSKLNNFAFLRCNLKLKFVINASPFYYGLMKGCYQPLPTLTPSTIINDGGTRFLIPYSQRCHVDLHPQLSEGAEMSLPLFLNRSWLRINRNSDFVDMGLMDLIVYSALKSANGVTGQGCSVQIYAWAEDVKLSGPTLSLAMQGDEYGDGVVSAPASTVARIAGMIKGIPILSKFATATEIGANAVSGIAKLFGWTNVPVITDAQPYRMVPFPQFASPEIGYPTEKLTIDAKNELSVDPRVLGLPSDDCLAIESLVTRKSYLCRVNWDTTEAVDSMLFASRVTPFQFETELSSGKVYLTPMAMVSKLFQEWRGDVIFTFQFVTSPFHKGRVRISFDPYSTTVQTAGDVGSTLYNTIVDLGETREVDVRIPFQQALQWLSVDSDFSAIDKNFITSGSSLTLDDTTTNGLIVMKSLTLLTAPVAASNVDILVYVRGAENLEFANPIHPGNTFTRFTIQGDEQGEEQDTATQLIDFKSSPEMYLERYRLNFGECVKSLRPLLRRVNYSETFTGVTSTDLDYILWQRHGRYPLFYGYDPNGLHSAVGTVVPGSNFPFNFTKNSPYHWIAGCFIGQKGSVNWHYNSECDFPTSQFSVTRINARTASQVVVGANSRTGATNNPTAAFYASITNGTAGGMSLTNTRTQSGLNVSIPNYTQYLFESTNPGNASKPPVRGTPSYDGTEREFVQVQVHCDGTNGPKPQNVKIHKHFGVGTDFNFYYFLNVPTYLTLANMPNAA